MLYLGMCLFLMMQHALYRVAFSCCIMRFSTVFLRFMVATPRYVHNRKNPHYIWRK